MDQQTFDYVHNLGVRKKMIPPGFLVLRFTDREWKAFRFLPSFGLENIW